MCVVVGVGVGVAAAARGNCCGFVQHMSMLMASFHALSTLLQGLMVTRPTTGSQVVPIRED